MSEGMTQSQATQDQFLQEEASQQPRTGGRRAKMSEDQRKARKRQNDVNYRLRKKNKVNEMTAENGHMKDEIGRLSAENRDLKEETRRIYLEKQQLEDCIREMRGKGQLPVQVLQRQDGYISQPTSQVDQNVYVQDHYGAESNNDGRVCSSHRCMECSDNEEAIDGCDGLEISDLENLLLSENETTPNGRAAINEPTAEHLVSSEGGSCPAEVARIKFLTELDAEVTSNVELSDFTGLEGELRRFGRFHFPSSLIPTVERINSVYGDVSATSLISPSVSGTSYVLFCATIKEMEDLHLEQVTEDIMLKWRDVIKDALRLSFNVTFAMEHLKKIACAYFGRPGSLLLQGIDEMISSLDAELNDWKKKRAKVYDESKMSIDAAVNFNGVPVSTVNMEGYSSDGSTSIFRLKKPDDQAWGEPDDQWMDLFGLLEDHIPEVSAINGGLPESVTDQDQLNQVETSEGSYQTKSESRRPKLTQAQKRENKRLSDYRYRQKRKITADELSTENKHLRVENEQLVAENTLLKSLLCNGRDVNDDSKAEAEPRSGSGQPLMQKVKPTEPPAQGFVHLQARRTQAIDHHKGQGAVLLDEIFSYIQSLQRQVEFLSMELAAVGPRTNTAVEAFRLKDLIGENMNELQNLLEMIPKSGTCCSDEMPVSDLLTKIEADEESNVKFSDFSGLDGDRLKLQKYSFPLSLITTLERIVDACGNISAASKMNPSITEKIYIMFCACVKEMNQLRIEELTKDRILKWRDVIKEALRISFKVDFAMEHLKKIAHAYIGRMERQKVKNMIMKISMLEDDLSSVKQELSKIYKQSKVYIDVADDFSGKFVGSGTRTQTYEFPTNTDTNT